MSYQFDTIGVIQTPFSEKFGIPRQPRLTPDVKSTVILHPQYSSLEAVDGLQEATHLWLIFVFSECYKKGWKNKVRPPRLGGNKKVGVFATRSPFRPNPIGMSAVKLESISQLNNQLIIEVSGADLLNNTPILDIKPYIPYSDNIENAQNQLADTFTPLEQPIFFSSQAQQACEIYRQEKSESLSLMIEQVLRCDPRPAYHCDNSREYGVSLYNFNIRWQITAQRIDVLTITLVPG
jgi:tRNA-Thr(GGU) m(6)t(6)A37 methyltransferase TsaA